MNNLTLKVLDLLDHYCPLDEARTLSAEIALADPQTAQRCAALTLREGTRLMPCLPLNIRPGLAQLLSGLRLSLGGSPVTAVTWPRSAPGQQPIQA